jgi:succinoglycan biosynthesis protein ExoM
VKTAVCIASYQRPDGLRTLLDSIANQRGIDDFLVVVVDNDPQGSAGLVVREFSDQGLSVRYEIEPEPGIPAARNRSISVARGAGVAYVAFIDDDEFASPYWLATMVSRIETSGASAVSGPVEPVFPDGSPGWTRTTRLYHRSSFLDGAKLDFASTANSLLRLEAIAGISEPFERSLQVTGGSDTFLYRGLRQRGGSIIWEPAGLVYESVPKDRLTLRWNVTRAYRHGVTLGLWDRKLSSSIRQPIMRAIRGLAQLPIGLAIIAGSLVRGNDHWRRGLTRIARGVGVVVGLSGWAYQEYRRE